MNMKQRIILCVQINVMIHGATDIPVNNLPFYVWSLMFGSDTQAVQNISEWSRGGFQSISSPAPDQKGAT